jgi:hypothetical protein
LLGAFAAAVEANPAQTATEANASLNFTSLLLKIT